MTNAIENAVAAVEQATDEHDDAREALAIAAEARDAIVGRVTDLETERTSVLTARRNGDIDDATSGARIALIDADTADLKVLLAEAVAKCQPLQAANDNAKHRVAAAEQALVTEQEGQVLKQLLVRADELGDLLFQTVNLIDGHRRRLGTSRPLWAPARGLADLLYKLHLQRVA